MGPSTDENGEGKGKKKIIKMCQSSQLEPPAPFFSYSYPLREMHPIEGDGLENGKEEEEEENSNNKLTLVARNHDVTRLPPRDFSSTAVDRHRPGRRKTIDCEDLGLRLSEHSKSCSNQLETKKFTRKFLSCFFTSLRSLRHFCFVFVVP